MPIDGLLLGEEELRVVLLPSIESAIGVNFGWWHRKLADLVRIADEGRRFALMLSFPPLLCRTFIAACLLIPQEYVLLFFWTGRRLLVVRLALLTWVVHRLRLTFSGLIIIFKLVILLNIFASASIAVLYEEKVKKIAKYTETSL